MRVSVLNVHGPAEPGNDARRDGRAPRDTERVADRDDRVADLERVGVAEAHGREPGAVDLDDREILRAVLADDAPAVGGAVAEGDDEVGRRVGGLRVRDVRVRDDDAVGRDDEAGSGSRLAFWPTGAAR